MSDRTDITVRGGSLPRDPAPPVAAASVPTRLLGLAARAFADELRAGDRGETVEVECSIVDWTRGGYTGASCTLPLSNVVLTPRHDVAEGELRRKR